MQRKRKTVRRGGGSAEALDIQKSLYWLSYGATLSGIGCCAFPFSNVPKLKALGLVNGGQSLKSEAETSQEARLGVTLLLEIPNLENISLTSILKWSFGQIGHTF